MWIMYVPEYQSGDGDTGTGKVWGNLGDWLGPEDNKNDKTLMWEAYFLYDLDIMKKVAQRFLGKKEDAEKFESCMTNVESFF